MAYADYGYYTEVFRGNSVSAEAFDRLAERASEYIDYLTNGKACASFPEVKKACCALAEVELANERAKEAVASAAASDGLASESVGSWSRSYHSAATLASQSVEATDALSRQMYNVAFRYLAHTGLLYRGGSKCFRTL